MKIAKSEEQRAKNKKQKIKINIIFLTLCSMLYAFCTFSVAEAKVYIDISSPAFKKLPIAVQELSGPSGKEISDIVKNLEDREIKKYVSIIYLYLFRFMRFMSFIDITAQRSISLNSSLLILALLRSEINIFQDNIEKAVKKIKEPDLAALLTSVSYQFSMEKRSRNSTVSGVTTVISGSIQKAFISFLMLFNSAGASLEL